MNKVYIGLDVATVMGVAAYLPEENMGFVAEAKGTPPDQLSQFGRLLEILHRVKELDDIVFVFEQLHDFRNAKTTRDLLRRQGFIEWTFAGIGFEVHSVAPDVARKSLGVIGKEGAFRYFAPYFKGSMMTSNHSDAMALALYQAKQDGIVFDPDTFKLESWV